MATLFNKCQYILNLTLNLSKSHILSESYSLPINFPLFSRAERTKRDNKRLKKKNHTHTPLSLINAYDYLRTSLSSSWSSKRKVTVGWLCVGY